MKSRKLVMAFLAALALAVGLAFFLWPRDTADPRLRLKIVGHAVENGKLVVFFKVELADRRRIQITWVEKVIGDRVEAPFKFSSLGGLSEAVPDFWAASQSWPIGDPGTGRKAFGVVAPTNAPIWKLRVTVSFESPSQWERFKAMPGVWRILRKSGSSVYAATKNSWEAFHQGGSQVVESDLIPNTVTELIPNTVP